MSQLTEVIVKSGLIPLSMFDEMKRWGLPVAPPPASLSFELQADLPLDALCTAIDLAMQSENYALPRETDLEALPQYLNTMRTAILRLVLDDGQESDIEVLVGQMRSGEFIIPWQSESITDLMTNGETHLRVDHRQVFFCSARELFYGNNKAFIVCTPSSSEALRVDIK